MNTAAAPLPQDLEAPALVLALVRETAVQLGASTAQAREAARTGIIELENCTVSVALSADEESLVLAASLPPHWFDDPARRVTVLQATTALMLQAGVAFARSIAGPSLICRWSLGSPDAGLLAEWIRLFAGLVHTFTTNAARTDARAA